MNQKGNKGITLIALVITIIVLLILAGVTISMVLGDDGIIAQAQQAKQENEEATKEDEEAITKAEGAVDLYTEGTVANMVEVGDYIEYNYTPAEYSTAETGDTGSGEQKFSSKISEGANGFQAAQVTKWRVLSKKDGIVKLISEDAVSSPYFEEKEGALNATNILNDMCAKLYASDIGTARSIRLEDTFEIAKYDGTKYYYTGGWNGTLSPIPEGETFSWGDVMEGYDFIGESPTGVPVADIENWTYDIDAINTGLNTNDTKKIIVRDGGGCDFANNLIVLHGDAVWDEETGTSFGSLGFGIYCAESWDYTDIDDSFYCYLGAGDYSNMGAGSWGLRPVITLKSGLEIEGRNEDGEWMIKGN